MQPKRVLVVLAICSWAGLASAQSTTAGRAFDINLNDDVAAAAFHWRLGNQMLMADVGWLHNQDRGDVVHAGMHLVDVASSRANALVAGLGLRLAYVGPDGSDVDGGALGLGGFLRYVFPRADRLHVGGHAYYAPDVTSFGDVEEYYEVGARFGYNVLRDADVYLGVRTTKADFGPGGDVSFDSGVHVGFQFRF